MGPPFVLFTTGPLTGSRKGKVSEKSEPKSHTTSQYNPWGSNRVVFAPKSLRRCCVPLRIRTSSGRLLLYLPQPWTCPFPPRIRFSPALCEPRTLRPSEAPSGPLPSPSPHTLPPRGLKARCSGCSHFTPTCPSRAQGLVNHTAVTVFDSKFYVLLLV